jgi:hypothetical protein
MAISPLQLIFFSFLFEFSAAYPLSTGISHQYRNRLITPSRGENYFPFSSLQNNQIVVSFLPLSHHNTDFQNQSGIGALIKLTCLVSPVSNPISLIKISKGLKWQRCSVVVYLDGVVFFEEIRSDDFRLIRSVSCVKYGTYSFHLLQL